MPFGLKNSPMTFMRFLHEVLDGIPNCYAYLDDIVVFTDDHASHLKIVDQISQRLSHYGLALSLKKCAFAEKRSNF